MTSPTTSDPAIAALLGTVEPALLELSIESQRADWVAATHITDDTEILSAQAQARLIRATVDAMGAAARLADRPATAADRRKIELLRRSLSLVTPADPALAAELTRVVASMGGKYGKARYAPKGRSAALDVQALGQLLVESRDPALLEDVWTGWHETGRLVRDEFLRYVALGNQGAREVGFADMGAMWRARYDMPPDAFEAEVERLWQQVRPLYRSLHAYVRRRLVERYGAATVPPRGPIPAHLLGNLWAQSWEHVIDLVGPRDAPAPPDLTAALRAKGYGPTEMVRLAERFFVSLGLRPLPPSFWERSMFVRPPDREVVCHASAWDIDFVDDLRIKMCIDPTGEELRVIHHELGHNYYQWAYAPLPFLFRDGAHDGFHEAIGDTIALSVTPAYLARVGLLDPAAAQDDAGIGPLLVQALEKIAFLPFGLGIDRWRWRVFSGEIPAERLNTSWWALRREYQGVAPPGDRSDPAFDPGAKAHVPGNVPYMRYFLAHILQFQFHRALAREAGATGPLHAASIFGSTAAGDRLSRLLAMGQREPWPDALEAATGERRMDAAALLEYFEPLQRWLDRENAGEPVGW
ncbi:MAG TPA: M2 family metallopeptidase [Thermoplasmata archaeon]|nr:M2 family metallopeptidase [Thermoplasmata archaeon]